MIQVFPNEASLVRTTDAALVAIGGAWILETRFYIRWERDEKKGNRHFHQTITLYYARACLLTRAPTTVILYSLL